jgi:sugar phosphate isomerase/epimerase
MSQSDHTPSGVPTIALSARWDAHPDRFRWIAEHGFAIAYAPNPEDFSSLAAHVDPLLKAGVPVRYHGFLRGYEFGHQDAAAAKRGLRLHLLALEAMQGRGEQVITVHVGLIRDDPIDPERAIENLTRILARAKELGITVCLENLRRGPTSDPETVVVWARASGAMITLDVGHANSCERVESGKLSTLDFVAAFADRLHEVHMYERERHGHHPPKDMSILGPIVDRLVETRCSWWTIELDDYDEALSTRGLLLDYLQCPPHSGGVDKV